MYERYAVYFTPQGPLAERGAGWLGWDIAKGRPVPHPVLAGLDPAGLTAVPRRYGLHATLKAPFALAAGYSETDLKAAMAGLCAGLAPVELAGLVAARIGGFIGLIPRGALCGLNLLAAQAVTQLDRFRAPASRAELARRRQPGLSPVQEAHLLRWGYPYVLDQFRFHITLTGPVAQGAPLLSRIAAHFAPVLPVPFVIDSLTLAGQGRDGMFREIHRYALCPR